MISNANTTQLHLFFVFFKQFSIISYFIYSHHPSNFLSFLFISFSQQLKTIIIVDICYKKTGFLTSVFRFLRFIVTILIGIKNSIFVSIVYRMYINIDLVNFCLAFLLSSLFNLIKVRKEEKNMLAVDKIQQQVIKINFIYLLYHLYSLIKFLFFQ